jgi:hypothetical protein
MNKSSCLLFTAITIFMTAIPSVAAGAIDTPSSKHHPSFVAGMADQPLIPLEKSLLWPNKAPSDTSSLAMASSSTHAAANALIRGLLVANRTGEVGYTSMISYRIQDVVRNLRRGKPITVAGNRCNVPEPVIGRLLQLGKYTASLN